MEAIIHDYIAAYNNFDIERMLVHLHENITFRNIADGVVNMTLTGLPAFKEQAQQAVQLFSKRTQTIKAFKHVNTISEVDI